MYWMVFLDGIYFFVVFVAVFTIYSSSSSKQSLTNENFNELLFASGTQTEYFGFPLYPYGVH